VLQKLVKSKCDGKWLTVIRDNTELPREDMYQTDERDTHDRNEFQ
jgi:hypothetical protein